MPTSKQAAKRMRQSEALRIHNRSMASAMKTAIKRFEESVEAKDKAAATERLDLAVQRIDKCAKRNIIHHNTAARKKSRLKRSVNALQ